VRVIYGTFQPTRKAPMVCRRLHRRSAGTCLSCDE
jgi:hypothetical protein